MKYCVFCKLEKFNNQLVFFKNITENCEDKSYKYFRIESDDKDDR